MAKRTLYRSSVLAAALATLVTAGPVRAETVDKLAFLTFSGRVQIPGAQLDAGTYRFRLADADTGRNVVQVLSNDGRSVYAMFHTIPDSRTVMTSAPTVTFRETPAGVPPAVRSLFYGYESRGYEFVYPKGGPVMKMELAPQPPITYAPTSAAVPDATISRVEPPPVAALTAAEPAAAAPALEPQAAPPVAPSSELPRTASSVPLVALGGLASLVAGLGAALTRRLLVS